MHGAHPIGDPCFLSRSGRSGRIILWRYVEFHKSLHQLVNWLALVAKDYAKITLNGTYELLKIAKESSAMFAPLSSTIGGVIACIDLYKVSSVASLTSLALFHAQKTSGNHQEMDRVLKSIDQLASILAKKLKESEDHKRLEQIIKNLSKYASACL